MSLNLSKTQYIIFKTKNKNTPENLPSVKINDIVIQRNQSVCFLGVIIQENLNWSSHISHVCTKVSRGVGILRKLRTLVPTRVLYMIYYSIIFPHLNYCNIVWGNTYKTNIDKLLSIQKKCIRIITKSPRMSHSSPLFKETNILPLYDLIKFNSLNFMYSFYNGTLPPIFDNMFMKNTVLHSYCTRQQDHYHQPKVRSTALLQSFKISGIKLWNQLDINIKSCPSLCTFKKHCRDKFINDL